MTGLWLAAVLMTVSALAAVLWPLLRFKPRQDVGRGAFDITVYKDQLGELERDLERGLLDETQAEAAKIEIQRRLLAAAGDGEAAATARPKSFAVAAVIAALVPAGGFGLYLYLGSPDMPNQPFAERNISKEITARQGKLDKSEVMQMAGRLESQLRDKPNDVNALVLLGRTYLTVNETESALSAFRQALKASNREPAIVAIYAEALVIAEQGALTAEAEGLFRELLTGDPFSPKARYYLGLGMAQRGQVKEALQAWVDLLALSPRDAPWFDAVNEQITRAATALGVAPGSVQPSAKVLALSLTQGLGRNRPQSTPPSTPQIPQPSAPQSTPRGPSAEDVKAARQMSADDRSQMIRSMVKRLADRLKDGPDDLEGWKRLARAYEVLGETEKAKDARAKIEALSK